MLQLLVHAPCVATGLLHVKYLARSRCLCSAAVARLVSGQAAQSMAHGPVHCLSTALRTASTAGIGQYSRH